MRKNTILAKYFAYFLLLGSAALGGYIALNTVQQYAVIARAALGIAVIYFVVQRYIWSVISNNASKEESYLLFEFPRNFEYFAFAFVICLLSTWAMLQVVYMLFFYFSK